MKPPRFKKVRPDPRFLDRAKPQAAARRRDGDLVQVDELPPAKNAAIHRALLSGLLSNIGVKGETHEYVGARSTKFSIFPGSTLFKAKPQWLMSAELVETTKLYARVNAPIRAEWVESLAQHLVRREYFEPHWQGRTGHVVAYEKVSLYGLVLVPKRLVHYGPIDPVVSRQLFIANALVEMDFKCDAPFMRHNRALIAEVELLEAKARKRDILADSEAIYAVFDGKLPADVYDGPKLQKWLRDAERQDPRILFLRREEVLKRDPLEITPQRYPDEIAVEGVKLKLEYRFDSASRADGVTAVIPLVALGQVPATRFDWLVPGMLRDKILELIRSLPKPLRTQFIPNADHADAAANELAFGEGSLVDAVALYLGKKAGTLIPPSTFDPKSLPPWLNMNFRVIDEQAQTVAEGRDLEELRRELRVEVRETFAKLPPSPYHRDAVTRWDFGDLPDKVEVKKHGLSLAGFPALVEEGQKVAIRTLESEEAALLATRGGVRRLFMIQLIPEIRRIVRTLPDIETISLNYSLIGKADDGRAEVGSAIADRALSLGGWPLDLRTRDEFVALAERAWKHLGQASSEISGAVAQSLELYRSLSERLSQTFAPALQPSANDMRQQLARLVYPGFIARTPFAWLVHLPRYLRGIDVRLTKLLNAGLNRDVQQMQTVQPFVHQYVERRRKHRIDGVTEDGNLETFFWMLEELRVSLFAQELKTSMPISPQRLDKQWTLVKP
jgi:ATP-dependent helicase HrpA